MQCGLLGRKLGHSYSPQIHSQLGSYDYRLFEKEPEELEDFLKNGDFTGLNVTIPYKKDVIPFLDELSPRAKTLGAVNTIVRRNGKLIGHNTDYFGFETMLLSTGVSLQGKKALVCGSGGASSTVTAVLKAHGANVVVLSRTGNDNYQNLNRHSDAALIVNATPVGMYPNVEASPIEDLAAFPMLEGVLDLVYNPARTSILLKAEALGIPCVNGLRMLVAQAKESAEWFTGEPIDDSCIEMIYSRLRRQMENIILIGMPGCGKTTIGASLARILSRPLKDADAELEQAVGRKITEILPTDGEASFRSLESETLLDLGKQSGLVIATGGGCVTIPNNYEKLHRNGTIVWLKRDLDLLPTDGRPLSQTGHLQEMYQKRAPLYARFADFSVENSGDPQETAEKIIRILEDRA